METRSRTGKSKPKAPPPDAAEPPPKRNKASATKKDKRAREAVATPIVGPNAFAALSDHGDRLPPDTPDNGAERTPVQRRKADTIGPDESVSQYGDDETEQSDAGAEGGDCSPTSSREPPRALSTSEGEDSDPDDHAARGREAETPSTHAHTAEQSLPRRTLAQSIAAARLALRGAQQGAPSAPLPMREEHGREEKENRPKRNLTFRGLDPNASRVPDPEGRRITVLTEANRQEYSALLLRQSLPVAPPPVEFLPPRVVPPYGPQEANPLQQEERPAQQAHASARQLTSHAQPNDYSRRTTPPPADNGPAKRRLTQSTIQRARMPVGAPTLPAKKRAGKEPARPTRTDRSPHGREVMRDSEVPHKRPRLHGAGPIGKTTFLPEARLDGFTEPCQDPRTSPLQLLADAAARARASGATPGPSKLPRAPPPMASLREHSESPEEPQSAESGGEDSSEPQGPPPQDADDEATSIPTIAQASIEDFVAASGTALRPTTEPNLSIAPTPPSGFPDQHGGGPGWQLENQDKENLAGWLGIPGGKVLAVAFGQGANDHKIADKLFATVAHVQDVITKYLGVPTAHVSPPIAAKPVTDLNQPPYAYLVHGFSEGRAAQLVSQRCISTPNVTVIIYPFAMSLPALFVTFGHITDCGCDMVRYMAIATMTRGPNFLAIIELLKETPGLPAAMDFVELARRLINTVRISRSEKHGRGASLTPVYSLYMSTSVMTADTWWRWHRLLNGFTWRNIFLAEVVVRNDVECEGCHGRDHHQYSCPFMQVPGWHGVMPQAKKWPSLPSTSGPKPAGAAPPDAGSSRTTGPARPPRNNKGAPGRPSNRK